MKQQLDKIFSPETIAVIGASTKDHSVGHAVLKNLISGGFEGTVYPVNPHHRSVLGIRCYSQVKDIPEKVDLAIITTPARTVLSVVESCGKAKVGGLVIISAGFKEAGEEGEKMSGEILKTARKYGMRFLGTNCLGFIHPALKINASFAQKMAKPGKVAFISQSGALCTAILDWAEEKNVGFSHFVSGGSMQDIGFHDLIDYFGADRHTAAILVYMESLTDSRKFLSAARAFARTKPIILLKAGKSSEGAKSALSHTGSIAGNDDVFDAAFKRAGITRVDTIEQLFDVAQAIAMQPLPEQNRLAIVTNAGGPGVLATDFLMENGGALAQLTETTMTQLNCCPKTGVTTILWIFSATALRSNTGRLWKLSLPIRRWTACWLFLCHRQSHRPKTWLSGSWRRQKAAIKPYSLPGWASGTQKRRATFWKMEMCLCTNFPKAPCTHF